MNRFILRTCKTSRHFSDWIPKQNQPLPFDSTKWTCFDPKLLQKTGDLYGLMISSVIPRPIALMTTISQNNSLNCAPFSYFNVVSHDPPLLIIGCNLHGRTNLKKDTLRNVEETGQFVVNIMSEWHAESANHTSGLFPSDVNELAEAGLTTIASIQVKPPRVAESAVQFECEVCELKPILNDSGIHTVTLIFGKVVKIHVHKEVLTSDDATENSRRPIVDYRKLRPLGRLGGDTYSVINDTFDLKRPKIDRQKKFW